MPNGRGAGYMELKSHHSPPTLRSVNQCSCKGQRGGEWQAPLPWIHGMEAA